ncbi:MAG: hypothetical protein IKJ72_01070, partial [Mycoplasmataceae bacterium]|nr:hypothetical protein [Mycoplasmataceae bacterium]
MKRNKLLIGLGSLITISLPLLSTISCSKKQESKETQVSNVEVILGNQIKDKYASPYKRWNTLNNSTSQKPIEEENEEYLKNELNKYSSNIFTNKPSDATIKEVKIDKEYTIGSIQNGYDAAHGAVYVVVTLDKYYDKNGKLIQNGNDKFYFKVTGFKVDQNINSRLDLETLYDDRERNAITLKSESIKSLTASSIKPDSIDKSKVKESIIDALFGVSQTNPTTYTLSKIKNKAYGDEQWETTISKEDVSKYFDIDWKNNKIVDNDNLGVLELEVTFKNIWWKNGVFQQTYKKRLRFSGFKVEYTEATYNPNLLVVKKNNENVALITKAEFSSTDFLGHLLTGFIWDRNKPEAGESQNPIYYTIKKGIEEELNKETDQGAAVKGTIKKVLNGESITKDEKEQLIKTLLKICIKYSIKKDNIDDNLFGFKRADYIVGINEHSTLEVNNVWWDDNGDWFSFSLKVDNDKEFKFKFFGFLGVNNYNKEATNLGLEENSNNDSKYKNYFDFKWVGHQYPSNNSNQISNSQFDGYYWYSLDLVIKNDSQNTDWKKKFDLIKKESDFVLIYNKFKVAPYEVKISSDKVTLSFGHESWSSLSNGKSNPTISLAVDGLGLFDFNKIFKNDEAKLLKYDF